MRYLEGGTVLQTDSSCEDCVPRRDMRGGDNYFNRESRIMHVVRIMINETVYYMHSSNKASYSTNYHFIYGTPLDQFGPLDIQLQDGGRESGEVGVGLAHEVI